MSWEDWGRCLKETQTGAIAANECGIYSLEGLPWYTSNKQLDSETVKELAKVFSDASVCSVMYRGSKYFKIQIDENMAKFKCSERGLVVGLGNGFILVAETDGPSNPLCNCVVALNHVLQALNNAQIGQ